MLPQPCKNKRASTTILNYFSGHGRMASLRRAMRSPRRRAVFRLALSRAFFDMARRSDAIHRSATRFRHFQNARPAGAACLWRGSGSVQCVEVTIQRVRVTFQPGGGRVLPGQAPVPLSEESVQPGKSLRPAIQSDVPVFPSGLPAPCGDVSAFALRHTAENGRRLSGPFCRLAAGAASYG